MTPILFTILLCLIIIELAVLIAVCHKKTKCRCNSQSSTFSNIVTLSSEAIDNIWALTGCPTPLDKRTKDLTLTMSEKDARRYLNSLTRYTYMCGKTRSTICAHKDILTPEQEKDLQSLWSQHPTCKRNPFPRCYINTRYKGLTFPVIKTRFIRFMASACPEE